MGEQQYPRLLVVHASGLPPRKGMMSTNPAVVFLTPCGPC